MLNEKERLVELLKGKSLDTDIDVDYVADYLFENGVIVTPCKIGDTVYEAIFYNKGKFSHWNGSEVVGFHLGDYPKLRGTKRKQYIVVWHRFPNCICHIPLDSFGKTVFLEHQIEEAEKVLRGADNG